jgi:2-oxo-4-hydroxy-4-carboxy--5-ureidoimidazoline (OHCU) decarboxylase
VSPAPDLAMLNRATEAAFVAALGPLFESAPRFLTRLADGRPYRDWPALFEAARSLALALPEEEQVELVDAHPRLGAAPGSVSALSFHEQGYDRDPGGDGPAAAAGPATTELAIGSELAALNAAYEARFGFRYCVRVAGRSRAELLPGLRAALDADRAEELRRALMAVVDIARDRLDVLQGGAV